MKDMIKRLATNIEDGTSASASYLRDKISEHGQSPNAIAQASGISKGALSEMLNGKRTISTATIKKLGLAVSTLNAAELLLIRALEAWGNDLNKDTLALLNEVLMLLLPNKAEQAILDLFREFELEDAKEFGTSQGNLPDISGVPEYRAVLRRAYDDIHCLEREFESAAGDA